MHRFVGFGRTPYTVYYPHYDLIAPHMITDYRRVNALVDNIRQNNWIGDCLIGYPWVNKIQLINGTHRLAACVILDRLVPVQVYKRSKVWEAFGDVDKWKLLLKGELPVR